MGARSTAAIKADLQKWFSRIGEAYKITSSYDPSYNCASWAVNDTDRLWDPTHPDGYWPDGIDREPTVANFVAAFSTEGFELCDDPAPQEGHEIIAIYSDDDSFMHAARLLQSGRWTSKLGRSEDIQHETLDQLSGLERSEYGTVTVFMRRKLEQSDDGQVNEKNRDD
jgi:hypothetical protein